MSSREPEVEFDLDDPAGVLGYVRAEKLAAEVAERNVMVGAAAWAGMHSTEALVTEADWVDGRESPLPLAGPGAPEVTEYAVPELAAVLGLPLEGARRFLAEVIEVRYRLSYTWEQVVEGKVSAWKARRIAAQTMLLGANAARFVDFRVAWCAGSVGMTQLDRIIAEAITRFDPARAEAQRQREADGRHVTIRLADAAVAGGSSGHVDAVLDLADGRDLEEAVRQGAEEQRLLGSEESLDVRRARALGVLARRQLTLDYQTDEPTGDKKPVVRPRLVEWHVHSQAELEATGLVRVEETGGFITMAELKSWLGPDTQLTIRPVIDTAEHISVDRYEIPDRLKDQVTAKYVRCVHPNCTRRARKADRDHVVAHANGGATCSCNLAPLCRGHHRLKTHGGWTYYVLEPGAFVWLSPYGYQHLVNATGTHDITPDRHHRPKGNGCRQPAQPPDE